MDKQTAARRRLAQETDPELRLNIIVRARLGEELIDALPELIDAGACTFECFNTPAQAFMLADVQEDHPGLYVFLTIKVGQTTFKVNFAGLMQTFGDTGVASSITSHIIERKIGGRNIFDAEITEAEVYAMRTHYPVATLREFVELSGFYHVLKGAIAHERALHMLPNQESTHRVPAEQHLIGVIHHLERAPSNISPDGRRKQIRDMLIRLTQDADTLSSLDKVVAIIAAIRSLDRSQKVCDLLEAQIGRVLELHFSSQALTPTTNIEWLVNNGLLEHYGEEEHWTTSVDTALASQVSHGRMAMVFHFCVNYLWRPEGGRAKRRRQIRDAQEYIANALAPVAFVEAMKTRRYGVAAALAQEFNSVAARSDRERALELAIVHGQRITLQWAFTDH